MTETELINNIFCSVIASFIFLFAVLILFKPKILLSPFICKSKFKNGKEDFYSFKFINISIFSAYDVQIELLEVDSYPVANGYMNERLTHLQLVLDRVSNIPGYRPSWIIKNAPYAIVVRASEEISEILKDDYKSIIIKVTLRHGLTGLVKVFTKKYTDLSQIKSGKFNYGLKFAPIK